MAENNSSEAQGSTPKGEREKDGISNLALRDVYPDAVNIFAPKMRSLRDIKSDCLVVLDTNALLVPYGVSGKGLESIHRIYSTLVSQGRLIVPGRVAREFANNRSTKLKNLFQNVSRQKSAKIKSDSYPLIESLDAYKEIARLEEEIGKLARERVKQIEIVLSHIRAWTWDDPISVLYGELFSKGVVRELLASEEEIKTDLEWRLKHNIPPGYKDKPKEDDGIGDLLIWHTLLEAAQELNKDVVFVSGETKPDWWVRSEGQPLYVRFELIEEFRRRSEGRSFHISNFADFLQLFDANKEVVEEVRHEEAIVQQKQNYASHANKAESAVWEWLSGFDLSMPLGKDTAFDFFISYKNRFKTGVLIKRVVNPHTFPAPDNHQLEWEMNKSDCGDVLYVMVAETFQKAQEARIRVVRNVEHTFVTLVCGFLSPDGSFRQVAGHSSQANPGLLTSLPY